MSETIPNSPAPGMLRRGRGWLIGYGIISIIIGILAFVWPLPATIAATIYIGAALIVAGVAALIAGFAGDGHGSRWYDLLFGLLTLAIGCLVAFRPISGAISLTLLIAIWLIVRGVLEIFWGAQHREHRWIMVGMGVLNLLIAAFVLATIPTTALILPGYLLGFSFLMGGISAIAIARGIRKITSPAES